MSSTDERMGKVFRKASNMNRRRHQVVTPVMGMLAILLGVGLVGSVGVFTEWGEDVSISGLYGSSLMLGSDAGSYIAVALLAAAFAVAITLICINRSKKNKWYDSADVIEKDERHD